MSHHYVPVSVDDGKTNISEHVASVIENIMRLPEYLAFSISIGLLSIIGIVGNVPVVIVYFRRQDRKISSTFIKILAILDLLVCVFIMPYTLVYELHMINSDVVCRLFEFVRHFAVLSSNLTLVAIAAERYFAVCHFAKKFTVRNVHCGIMVVVVISVVVAIPAVLVFALVTPNDVKDVPCRFPHVGNNTHFCHFTTSIIGPLPAYLYQSLLMMVFFLSLLLIVIFYSVIYSKLWSRTKLPTLYKHSHRKYVYVCKSESSFVYGDFDNKCGQCLKNNTDTNLNNTECSQLPHYDTQSKDSYQSQLAVNPQTESQTRPKRLTLHYRTAKMLFMCTVIYLVTWIPFWLDIFGITNSLILRYLFFIGNATNPIVYGIFNVHVRRSFWNLLSELKIKINFICSKHSNKQTDNVVGKG